MIIEEEDFRLTPINDTSPKYDLELKYSIGGKNPREEFKVAAYGVSLTNALQYVIQYRINKKHKDAISLKEYIEEYTNNVESLKKYLNESE